MAFINQFIAQADAERFGIEEINRIFSVSARNAGHWTIDRERNIYLRCVANGTDEYRRRSTWTLYWNGNLLLLDLNLMGGGGKGGEPGWSHWRLQHMSLPRELEPKRIQILADLKEALTTYKDAGVYSTSTRHAVVLEVI